MNPDQILAEAHQLGFTDDELVGPSLDELVVAFLALPRIWELPSPKCYRRRGYDVHVAPDCRCPR